MFVLDHEALKRDAAAAGIHYSGKEAAVWNSIWDSVFPLILMAYEQGRKNQPLDILPYKEK